MTGTTDRGDAAAASSRAAPGHLRLWSILLLVLLSDQLTKWLIVEHSGFVRGLYPPFSGVELVPGFFNLVYTVNHGAAWGMFQGFSWLLVCLGVLVLALIAIFNRHLSLHLPSQQWAFGLICGGIIGNTIDRLLRGHVVDFLDFHLRWYRWPTFNIADTAIVVGTFAYILLQVRQSGSQSG
jgi:signal peptidase II